MTCIAAVTDGTTVVMGGDSAAAAGTELLLRSDPKVFRKGSYVVGFTTSFRMGQILRYGDALPEPPAGMGPAELESFLVSEVVEAVRREFEARGFAKTARAALSQPGYSEEGQAWGGIFLLGVAGRIFQVRQDYQVASPAAEYCAIGRGAPAALGALFALGATSRLGLGERVERALLAAESCCTTVRGPFHLVSSVEARGFVAMAGEGVAS